MQRTLLLIGMAVFLVGLLPMAQASPAALQLFPESAAACPSNTAVYELAIENTGQVKDTYTFSSSRPDQITIAPKQVTLEAGEKWQDPFVWYTPKTSVSPGTYEFTLYATSQTTGERFPITGTIEVLPCHNLQISQTNPSVSACIGEKAQVEFTVSNKGRNTENVQLQTDTGTLTASSFTLEPGTSETVQLETSGASAGEKTAMVEAHSQSSFAQSSKLLTLQVNRCFASEAQVTPKNQRICTGKSNEFDVVVRNTGTQSDTFTLSASGGTLETSELTIDGGESRTTTLQFTPKQQKTYNLQVRAKGKSVSSTSFSVTGANCRAVTVITTPSTNALCEDEQVEYDVEVKNTGDVADTYTLASNIGTLGATKVNLGPGEEDVVDLQVDGNALTQGSHLVKVRTRSTHTRDVSDFSEVTADVQNCYDLNMNLQQRTSNVREGNTVLFENTLQNTGSKENTYTVSLDGPAWISLKPVSATLAAGAEKKTFIHAAPPFNVSGRFDVRISAEDASGTVKKFESFTLAVNQEGNVSTGLPQAPSKSLSSQLQNAWQSVKNAVSGITAPLGLFISIVVGIVIVLLIVWRESR